MNETPPSEIGLQRSIGTREEVPLAKLLGSEKRSNISHTRRYSNFVSIMRFALPLGALFLLGLIILWPLVSGREEGFRVSFSSAPELDGSLRMVKARYMGVDDRNQSYTVTAAEANQLAPQSSLVFLKEIKADVFIDDVSGQWLALTAKEGMYERNNGLLDLTGNVSIYSDQGHEFHTEKARIDLDARIADGDMPVNGQSPFGILQAGNFHLDGDNQEMVFGNGVKLIIFPGKRG